MMNLNKVTIIQKMKSKCNKHANLKTAHICVRITVHTVTHNIARSNSDYLPLASRQTS